MVGVAILVMAVLETNLDYKAVAAKLQNDLRKSIERVEELEGKIAVLDNEIGLLKLTTEDLQEENDIQARNYTDLRRECEILKKQLLHKTKIVNDELLEDPELEKKFEEAIKSNFIYFKRYTDMKTLSPYLVMNRLLTEDECAELNRTNDPNQQSMKFYTEILQRKGLKAYRLFYRCLNEATQEQSSHEGHRDLLEIFVSVLN